MGDYFHIISKMNTPSLNIPASRAEVILKVAHRRLRARPFKIEDAIALLPLVEADEGYQTGIFAGDIALVSIIA